MENDLNLVVLDRDGVINQDSDAYIKTLDEWIPIPGSIDAIARLSQAGFRIVVATNQSGLGRGYFDQATLDAMHQRLLHLVEDAGGRIDGIFYCPHTPDTGCTCRKPKPGLLHQIAAHYGQPLAGSWMVGDSLRDLQAGLAVGCRPVLVRTGKGQRTLEKGEGLEDALVFDDLAGFADHLIRR